MDEVTWISCSQQAVDLTAAHKMKTNLCGAAMNQICILRSLHFSCLICRISSDEGGFGGRWWHDSRNEQDVSIPYTAVHISIVLARAREASWEVRDADARDAGQG